MGMRSKRKGASGERELARLLGDLLGLELTRNLEQTRAGGHDLLGVPGWAIECKRVEAASIGSWWAQAVEQAERQGLRPVLAHRGNRQPWRFVMRLAELIQGADREITITTTAAGFAAIVNQPATPAPEGDS